MSKKQKPARVDKILAQIDSQFPDIDHKEDGSFLSYVGSCKFKEKMYEQSKKQKTKTS